MSEKMSAVERLEEMLNARDAEIAELNEKLSECENQMDGDVWGWTRHSKSDEAIDLPVPRLEMRWEEMDGPDGGGFNWRCRYDLIYRHFLGHVMRVPLGMTRVGNHSGRPPVSGGVVETPFRDGSHIAHDAHCLRLPAFAICGDVVTKLEPREPNAYDPTQPHKPKGERQP